MNLATTQGRVLKQQYKGRKLYVADVLYRPIKITTFEIVKSVLHKGKDMLVAQVEIKQSDKVECCVLFTESYTLIKTIRGTEKELPHITKIVRKRDRYYYFVPLNAIEMKEINF